MRKRLVWASPLPYPQTPHAAGAACHQLASPQSGQGWKGLKTAVKLGKLTSVLQPLRPLLLLPAVSSWTLALPAPKKQNRTVPWACPVRREVERLPLA